MDRLGSDARTALSAAAVIGRDFELDLLLAVRSRNRAAAARPARGGGRGIFAGGEQEIGPGSSRLPYALVEHALREDLGITRRAGFTDRWPKHWRSSADEPGELFGQLAGHWAAAVVSTDIAKAMHYARLSR